MDQKFDQKPTADAKTKAAKLLEANFTNLARKVLAEKTLSVGEIKFLQAVQEETTEDVSPNENLSSPTFAKNQSELAEILGVSRQLVGWHVKRPNSPARRADGRYCVADWREYFAVYGRGAVRTQGRTRTVSKLHFGDGVYAALESIGERLPMTLTESLKQAGVKVSADKINLTSVFLFLVCAKIAEGVATRWGFEPFFNSDPCYPEAIVKAAKSVSTTT